MEDAESVAEANNESMHQDQLGDNEDGAAVPKVEKIEKLKFEDISAKMKKEDSAAEEMPEEEPPVNLSQISNEWEDTSHAEDNLSNVLDKNSQIEEKHSVTQHIPSERHQGDEYPLPLQDDNTLFPETMPSLYEDREESHVEDIDANEDQGDNVTAIPSTSSNSLQDIDYRQPYQGNKVSHVIPQCSAGSNTPMNNYVPTNPYVPITQPWAMQQNDQFYEPPQATGGFGQAFNSQFTTRNSMEANYPSYPPPQAPPIIAPFPLPQQEGKFIKASVNGVPCILPLGTSFSVCDALGSETNSTTLDFNSNPGGTIMLTDNEAPLSDDCIIIDQRQNPGMLPPPPVPLHQAPLTSSYQQQSRGVNQSMGQQQQSSSQHSYLSSLDLKPTGSQYAEDPEIIETSVNGEIVVSQPEVSISSGTPQAQTPRRLRDRTTKLTPEKMSTRRRSGRYANVSEANEASTSSNTPPDVQESITFTSPEPQYSRLMPDRTSAPTQRPHTTLIGSPKQQRNLPSSSSISSSKAPTPSQNNSLPGDTSTSSQALPTLAQTQPSSSSAPSSTSSSRCSTPSAAPRKPVCSFLVPAKMRALTPALNASGVASGRAPSPATPAPRKVCFFRRGSLGRAPR